HLLMLLVHSCFFFSSRRRHTRFSRDWSSDVCSSDLPERFQSRLHPRRQTKWLGWWPKREADLRKLAGNNLPPAVEVKVDGLAPHLLNYAVQEIEGFAQRILGPACQVRERPGVRSEERRVGQE